MSKDHNFITDFTEMYRSFPCLRKKAAPHYHITVKRENVNKILLEKYNEYAPKAIKQSLRGKINSLRSAYNKE
jgi:hypothetical protein